MKIEIVLDPKGKLEMGVKDSKDISYEDFLSYLLTAVEGLVLKRVGLGGNTPDMREMVYYQLDNMFTLCLNRLFPEFEHDETFSLTDAAIIKAMDDIIDEAHDRGMSFDEAMSKYNTRAKEYVNTKKMS